MSRPLTFRENLELEKQRNKPTKIEAVIIEVDMPFASMVGLAFKIVIAHLIALLCVGAVLAVPAFLIYQGTK